MTFERGTVNGAGNLTAPTALTGSLASRTWSYDGAESRAQRDGPRRSRRQGAPGDRQLHWDSSTQQIVGQAASTETRTDTMLPLATLVPCALPLLGRTAFGLLNEIAPTHSGTEFVRLQSIASRCDSGPPYGALLVLDANGTPVPGNTSNINQQITYTGQRLDPETSNYYFKNRYYDPDQGKFISRDPLGYVDGMNLYAGYFAMRFAMDMLGLDDDEEYERNTTRDGKYQYTKTPPSEVPANDAKYLLSTYAQEDRNDIMEITEENSRYQDENGINSEAFHKLDVDSAVLAKHQAEQYHAAKAEYAFVEFFIELDAREDTEVHFYWMSIADRSADEKRTQLGAAQNYANAKFGDAGNINILFIHGTEKIENAEAIRQEFKLSGESADDSAVWSFVSCGSELTARDIPEGLKLGFGYMTEHPLIVSNTYGLNTFMQHGITGPQAINDYVTTRGGKVNVNVIIGPRENEEKK